MHSFAGKKVLVAGGTGLIGIPLVKMLVEEGARVRIASLDDPGLAHPAARFFYGDLLDPKKCSEACNGVDYAFNLLCVKGSPEAVAKRPFTVFHRNILFNLNLLEAARQCGVKGFCFASSMAVYAPAEVFIEDDMWGSQPSENDKFAGYAKRMGELAMDAYRREYGLEDLVIVRPGNIYGPYDNFDPKNSMVIPSLIRRFVSGENPVVIWGDGLQMRDFLYADDAARAILLVAKHTPAYPVNVASGIGVSISELAEEIRKKSFAGQVPYIRYDLSKPTGDKKRILDVSRLRALGFTPQVSLGEGIQRTVEWYHKHKNDMFGRYSVFH